MSPSFDRQAVEIISTDCDNTVAWMGNVFVQVRTGRISVEAVNRMQSVARLLRVRTTGPVGAIAVLESGAEVVTSAIREKQREAVMGMMADPRTYMTAVIAGTGVKAALLRSVTRFVAPRMPRLHTARDIPDATAWLASSLGDRSAAELCELIAHVRAVARETVARNEHP